MLVSKQQVIDLTRRLREDGAEDARRKLEQLAAQRIEEGRPHHNQLVWMARNAIEAAR